MADWCDLAYVVWLDQIERQMLADRLLIVTMAGNGVEDPAAVLGAFPSVFDATQILHGALSGGDGGELLDPDRAALLESLGVGRAR